jgi:membrane associated rhomboid family serine protease
LVIFIFVRITFIPAALLIVVWFLIQLVNAGAVATVQTGGGAYLAHVGGCVFGAVTAKWFEDPQRIAEQRLNAWVSRGGLARIVDRSLTLY